MKRFGQWLVVLGAFAAPVTAEEAGVIQPTALLPFQDRGKKVEGMGQKVGDILFGYLGSRPDLYLVDRETLDEVLREQGLSASGLVKPDEAVRLGQLTGAKLLVSGSITEVEGEIFLVAKLIGTETGRTKGTMVQGKMSEPLTPLVKNLNDKIAELLRTDADALVAPAPTQEDVVAAIQKELGDKQRPKLSIRLPERHVGRPTVDPAAETELARFARLTGFEVVDTKQGAENQADIVIEGEAFSEFAARHQALVSVKARVEIKVVDRKTGNVLVSDRQTEVVADVAELIAGKTALQAAGAALARRVLPQLGR